MLAGAVGAPELAAKGGVVLARADAGDADPPHPAITVTRNARARIRIREGGTNRISQF